MEMKKKKIKFNKLNACLILISIIFAILTLIFEKQLKERCFFDLDCGWVIVNCCPEQAGARWECMNLKTFKPPKCPKGILCPQVLSPKPELGCMCHDWSCVAR
jgi:hypothetical protein